MSQLSSKSRDGSYIDDNNDTANNKQCQLKSHDDNNSFVTPTKNRQFSADNAPKTPPKPALTSSKKIKPHNTTTPEKPTFKSQKVIDFKQ